MAKPKQKNITIRWRPQPKQLKFLRACGLSHPFDGGTPRKPVSELIGYGGAAGGGKSDALIGAAIIYALTYPGARIGYFRQTFTQLDGSGGAIARSRELLTGFAKYNGSTHEWTFPNGATIRFCYLGRDADLPNYQSQQFEVQLYDESTQMTWYQIMWMQQRIRSAKGYPTFTAFATNPGGIGHAQFKEFFVKSGEPEEPRRMEVEEGKFKNLIFIPSRLADNQILEKADPEYRKKLENLPGHLRRQFLEGDWDVAEGMAFEEWRDPIHTCAPFEIPDEWYRFRTLDWGYAKPYCVGWYAVDFDGRLYKYRELYGWSGTPDKGTREDPEDVARKIIEAEALDGGKKEYIRFAAADDAIFNQGEDSSPSIAEQFSHAGVYWQKVGKGPRSRISGKLEMHHRLKWDKDAEGNWNGVRPMLVFMKNCVHSIRTIPNMILDDRNPEDVNSDLEDHSYDETRYACMSRPMSPKVKKEEPSRQKKHKDNLAKVRQFPYRGIG